MTFEEYCEFRRTTDLPSTVSGRFAPGVYAALGLAGETGEVLEKIKKLYRDSDGYHDHSWRESLKCELGDVLWYVSRIADDFGFDLEDVARENICKLKSRTARGKLGGSGDNR